ncbi:hypothetical protein C8F04DRAFT_1324313 [Mycena alexandri]|uniref:Uncharacterized protein n=1 Tax=Mycena alexandri TaxID=1745969 RepID=A0AAD6S1A5_9AGAR|nr:hypothetical protein C8F04DRAFT_1324313 [Mycena alexandri]
MRDPHVAIVRNVLIFPADGGKPRISPMTFNEAGARANPKGFYTINPDEVTNGAYDLFHNISPKLPVNVTMARVVGANPKKPGKRPLWRGDVVVVKTSEWPEPIAPGAGAHMDYLDVPPQAVEMFCSRIIPMWYKSNVWLRGHCSAWQYESFKRPLCGLNIELVTIK